MPTYRGSAVLTVYWEWTEPADYEAFVPSGGI
ncbi:hypothetical protein C8E86_7957 [Catellatospora citrea]|nr:hypothetical protein C8E86_7957 [Catellatospora citrea]